MDANIYDLVKETTSTSGSGLTITLTAETGFARFADVASVGEAVYYVIRDGNNAEVGIGTVQASNTLDRTTPLTTLVSGTYDNTTPVKITLSGSATVAIAPTAAAVLDAANDPGGIGSFKDTSIAISSDDTALANDDSTLNNNIGLGVNAGNALTISENNVYLGTNAGQFNESGNNVGIGEDALKGDGITAPSGGSNIGIGGATGEALTSGFSNTLLGDGAGSSITSGSNNTALGESAGSSVTTGTNSVLLGNSSGLNVTTAVGSIAIGLNAMQGDATTKLTGAGNIGIGLNCGGNLGIGTDNVLLGQNAGENITTADNSIAIGEKALFGSTGSKLTGNNNIGIGLSAGQDLSTGNFNVLLGYFAGENITSGASNVAIGGIAMAKLLTGTDNIAIGSSAMEQAPITGNFNIGIGEKTGYSIAAGAKNTFIGFEAGRNVTTGDLNIGIGNSALLGDVTSKLTGDANIGIGEFAGTALTSGGNNVLLGREAGESVNSGSFNTYIGFQAGELATTGARNVFVGFQAGDAVTTSSDLLKIANNGTTALIDGDFSAATLDINGVLKATSLGVIGEFTLPTADGTAGDILVTDGAGALTFEGPIAFHADLSSGTTITADSTDRVLVFDAEQFDTNAAYSTSDGKFLPSVAGYYQINLAISIASSGSPTLNYLTVGIDKNGSTWEKTHTYNGNGAANMGAAISGVVFLNGTTDYVQGIYQTNFPGTVTALDQAGYTNSAFSGHLIR